MPRPYSINRRTLLTMTVVLICFLGIVGWVLDQAFRDSVAQGEQQRLETTFYGLLAVADVTPSKQLSIPNFLTDERLNRPGSGLFAAITNADNKIVWQSRSLLGKDVPTLSLVPEGTRIFKTSDQIHPYLIYAAGIGWELDKNSSMHFSFYVLSSPDHYIAQITQFRKSLWGWLIATTVILLIIQFALLRWSLSPLRRVTSDLRDVENAKQNKLSGHYPVELAGLTHNLNHLLKTREQQLTRYRNSLADLAHSLKTPLAVLRGLEEENTGNKNQTEIIEQTDRMARIVDYQLQRASTAGHAGLSTSTAMQPVIERLIASLDKVYTEKNIHCEVSLATDTELAIEENDLMELMGNLLDNAYKWANHQIRLSTIRAHNSFSLLIEDDGPGINIEETSRLMQRGARADLKVDGQGIGLAVCHDIVSAYQGTIKIEKSELDGAKIVITLSA